jgi:hypothetical protein
MVPMHKKIIFILPLLALFLSSCFDIKETYNLNQDGSYTLDYNMDMSGLLEIANTMMPDSMKQSPTYSLKKDTTVEFSNLPDSLKSRFNIQEKELLMQTKMRTQMDLAAGIFKIGIETKGKSLAGLNYFLSNFGTVLDKGKGTIMMMPPSGEKTGDARATDAFGGQDPDLPFKNKEYDYVITANSFERKIRPEVLAASNEKKESLYAMMKGMSIKMKSTVIINLPKPATSIENSKATLSADKKQFKLALDMMEAIAHPEMLNFKINY